MRPRVRALDDYWRCPRCNLPNLITSIECTPTDIQCECTSCHTMVNVFVPLQQDGPYRADGLMNDQIGGELKDTSWWDFVCPLCQTKNRSIPPPHKLGQPKEFNRIMPCAGCHKNIRIQGRN